MDPLPYTQLVHELHSVKTRPVPVDVGDLAPGHVIADGIWNRHVVVEHPERLNKHTARLVVAVRHLYGGHTLRPYFPGHDTTVSVHRARMGRPTPAEVPVVPDCVVPETPAVGDRVVLQQNVPLALGYGHIHRYDGEMWVSESFSDSGRRTVRRYETASMRAFVRTRNTPMQFGWYSYLPADEERPHLHMDGHPVPARTVEQLNVGDVVLISGGGRLLIEDVARDADGHRLSLVVLAPSWHPGSHLTWLKEKGDRVEHQDSGCRGMVYATEPRADEARQSLPRAA